MRIAIPVANGRLSTHFGHCEQFAFVDTDPEGEANANVRTVEAPPHAPGLLPRWLSEQGAHVVIAGGIGQRAQALLAEQGIDVVVGAPAETPDVLVARHLAGTLATAENACDH